MFPQPNVRPEFRVGNRVFFALDPGMVGRVISTHTYSLIDDFTGRPYSYTAYVIDWETGHQRCSVYGWQIRHTDAVSALASLDS